MSFTNIKYEVVKNSPGGSFKTLAEIEIEIVLALAFGS